MSAGISEIALFIIQAKSAYTESVIMFLRHRHRLGKIILFGWFRLKLSELSNEHSMWIQFWSNIQTCTYMYISR